MIYFKLYEFIIKGVVQGVGFRPFIYNSARKYNVVGFVQNISYGVLIVCDNKFKMIEILNNIPQISKIDSVEINKIKSNKKYLSFIIKESLKNKNKDCNDYNISIPADLSICDDCIKELNDENNFRYNYFFISCTNCGPRFSIVNFLPYDRINTSLNKFKMCDDCKDEYLDPENRRYHGQTIACPNCGPQISLYKNGEKLNFKDPIKKVSVLIKKGEVVAIKGIGGFHIVSNIEEKTIIKFKKIIRREYKPLALMAKNIDMIKEYVNVSSREEDVLNSIVRPIVILDKKDKLENKFNYISEVNSLGFMLPYTPVHYLLFNYLNFPIVMTSANIASHPISVKREEQFVDYVLDYDREITNFSDDSIVKIINEIKVFARKSRGYSIESFNVPSNYKSDFSSNKNIVAFGSELKNTFAIIKNNKIIVSQHIGSTNNLEGFENFKSTLAKYFNLINSVPDIVLSDLNSKFNITNYAKEFEEFELVQHHIAHGFSVAFEHNLNDFISIVCDGVGFGDDSNVWGGEVFHNDKRIGCLENQNLVGGDISNQEPVRMLVSILSKFMCLDSICEVLDDFDKNEIRVFYNQNIQKFNCAQSSSCGRILDCVSILLGFCDKNYYEGRCAMILESNCSDKVKMFFNPIIEVDKNGLYVLMTTPLFEFIVKNLDVISKNELARFAHIYIAKGLIEIAKMYQDKMKIDLPVCFSGGVAMNSIITGFMLKENVLINKNVSCSDGGISLGQMAYYLWKVKNLTKQ